MSHPQTHPHTLNERVLTCFKIPDLIMNSLIHTPSSLFLSFPSLFPSSQMQRQNRFNRRNERATHTSNRMESSKAYSRFLFSFFLFVLLHHANHSIPLFVYHLPSFSMYDFINWAFVFCFVIGLVRSGLGYVGYVLCLLSLFVLLQLCNWYIRAYIYLSIHILDLHFSGIITLFLYRSILDRVSSP